LFLFYVLSSFCPDLFVSLSYFLYPFIFIYVLVTPLWLFTIQC
jgi:hypothetical protein